MFRRTGSEKSEQERLLLLNRRSLETCPPELVQPLAYVLHLRSHWKPKGRAKLIVPTSWMEFLAFAANGKCRTECVASQRCPFGNVRFESAAEARPVVPDEEPLPRDVVSQFLTNDSGCLATLVHRAFEGIPRATPRSDVPAMGLARSQSTPWRIDFELVSGHDVVAENNTQCLLLAMKEPTQMQQHPPSASFDSRPGPGPPTLATIPEELTNHGRFHLTLLASLIRGGSVETTTKSFPEWLVLFGLLYDAHRVHIIAYVPRRRKSDVIDCAAYVVDHWQFSLRPGSVASVPACEVILERLGLLLALTALRRHVLHLSKSLFTVGPCNDIRGTDNLTCDQQNSDDPEPLKRCGSLDSSSEYSTCPSSVHGRELNDVSVIDCGEGFSSSCRSFASSCCSTCSSLLESTRASGSFYSEDSKNTDSGSHNYMEPSTTSLSHGSNDSVACSNILTGSKRRDIIAWAREVIPTEHPVKDTYKMVIHHPRVVDFGYMQMDTISATL